MSQASDYGERKSEPWTYSRNELPHSLYSRLGLVKCGKDKPLRPRYRRKRNSMKIEDVQRILARLIPPETESELSWSQKVILILKDSTLDMMDKILPWLTSDQVNTLYEFCIGLLDKLFGVATPDQPSGRIRATALIMYIADRAGLTVTIKKN